MWGIEVGASVCAVGLNLEGNSLCKIFFDRDFQHQGGSFNFVKDFIEIYCMLFMIVAPTSSVEKCAGFFRTRFLFASGIQETNATNATFRQSRDLARTAVGGDAPRMVTDGPRRHTRFASPTVG